MTNTEKNEAIAKALGWKWDDRTVENPVGESRYARKIGGTDLLHKLIPDAVHDANMRQEMLAVMKPEEKRMLGVEVRKRVIDEMKWETVGHDIVLSVLDLDQPTFADCWLKVMEFWKE